MTLLKAIMPSVNISPATSLNISLRELSRESVCADDSVDVFMVWDPCEQVRMWVIEIMMTESKDGKVVGVEMVVVATVDDVVIDST